MYVVPKGTFFLIKYLVPASLPPSKAGRTAGLFGSCTFFLSSTLSPYLNTAPSVLRGENTHELEARNT